MYGKTTETAIAAMSRLAEVYDQGATLLSAADIADHRQLQRPFVRKVLTTLAQAGLVNGTRGPGGGFTLAMPPRQICIHDVIRLFDRVTDSTTCPFGRGICGEGDPCPLHQKLGEVHGDFSRLLHETTFEEFREAYVERAHPS
jgi:Rrf2 family iron-sulfur cluster assembly transcriptional regulator